MKIDREGIRGNRDFARKECVTMSDDTVEKVEQKNVSNRSEQNYSIQRSAPSETRQTTAADTARKTAPEKSPDDSGKLKSNTTLSREAQQEDQNSTEDNSGATSFANAWKTAIGGPMSAEPSPRDSAQSPASEKKDAPQTASGEATKPAQGDAPKTLTKDEQKKKDDMERILNLAKVGAQVPDMLKLGKDIEKNGFTSENVKNLRGLQPDLEKIITPENMKFLKDNLGRIDSLLSQENIDALKQIAPDLADRLGSSEKLKQVKDNLSKLNSSLDRDKINSTLNKMAPWVNTANGEGTLNMLDRMIGDPTKLGGNDKTLSQEDFREIAKGVVNTQTGYDAISDRVWNDPRVQYRRSGRERWNIGKNFAYNKGMEMATNPDFLANQASQQNLIGNRGLSPSTVPRQFEEKEIQQLMDAAQRAQQMGLAQGGSLQGASDEQKAGNLMERAISAVKKSVDPKDGISQEEMHNISEVANMSYQMLYKLMNSLGE